MKPEHPRVLNMAFNHINMVIATKVDLLALFTSEAKLMINRKPTATKLTIA